MYQETSWLIRTEPRNQQVGDDPCRLAMFKFVLQVYSD